MTNGLRSAYQERSTSLSAKGKQAENQMVSWNPTTYRPDLRHKVARGGSFADSSSNCRVACRGRTRKFADVTQSVFGFVFLMIPNF